jgi:hypothetical protein
VFEPIFQQWVARAKTFTDLDVDFHQPPLNIHETSAGKAEILVQGNAGGQVLLSTDGGASFKPLCPPPEPGYTGSGVGILRDDTLLAATDSNGKVDPRQTWIHRGEITRGASGAVTNCRWMEKYRLQPLYAGDLVGGNCALRFSQAKDGTVYYMIMNERAPASPNSTLPVAQQFSFAALYASTDSGKSFEYRGSPGRYTDENNILPLGDQGLLALTRFQDESGLRSTSLAGPHYKQTAVTRSTDAGR